MKFAYVAYDRSGRAAPGVIEASSSSEASESLRLKGLFITKISETGGNGFAVPSRRARKGRVGGRGRRLRNLVSFTRQLHVLVTSGTPLVQAITSLERQIKDPAWHQVVADVRKRVEEGAALSDAMSSHPEYFDDVCRSLILAGEAGGKLEAMLERLGKLVRGQLHVRSSVVGALVYPCLLIVISIAVMAILLTFVLPRFAGMFDTLGSPLPPTTKLVMAISAVLRGYWWAILGASVAGAWALRLWIKSPTGQRRFDKLLVTAPVIGKLSRSFAVARITRLLGIQIESKVPLLDALRLTRQAAGNVWFKDLLQSAEDAATRGQPISAALAESELINPTVTEAVRSGEQTGQMASLLLSIAEYLDEENDIVVRSLTSIIEPLILVVLGLMVGFVALSM
ncbi:MAG: type II secretion system F family protein, partial [Tepidisphaeraceae bacterium]